MPLPTRADVHADVTQVAYTYEYQEAAGGAWQALTPNSGVSERGASSGNDPAFVLITSAGPSGGVFYRATPSAAWELRNTGLPTDATWRWRQIAVNPRNADDWLIVGNLSDVDIVRSGGLLTADGSQAIVWRTLDAGATWSAVSIPEPTTTGVISRVDRKFVTYTRSGVPVVALYARGSVAPTVPESFLVYDISGTTGTKRAEFSTSGGNGLLAVRGGINEDIVVLLSKPSNGQYGYVDAAGTPTIYDIGVALDSQSTFGVRSVSSREITITNQDSGMYGVADYRTAVVAPVYDPGDANRVVGANATYIAARTGATTITRVNPFAQTSVAAYTTTGIGNILHLNSDDRVRDMVAVLNASGIAYSVDRGETWQQIARPTTALALESFIGVINAPVSLDGITDHNISLDVAGNSALTVPFVGTAAETRMQITATAPRDVFAWRVTANWPSGESVIGVGFVDSVTEDDSYSITYDCSCASAVIRRVALYSDLFVQRRAATKTTATSIEDPSNPNYAGGLINWILWQTGGRPSAQAGSYPNSTYYYACDHSDIVLPHGWVAADDSWAELGRIVAAVGGWLYQTPDGVMTYKATSAIVGQGEAVDVVYIDQPTTVEDREAGSITVTGYQATTPKEAAPRTVTANYVIRAVAYQAEVYRDTTPIVLQASATHAAVIELQQPVDTREPISVMIEAVRLRGGSLLNGTQVTQSSVFTSAQRITLTITNTLTEPIVITGITVEAAPLVVVDEGASAINTAVANGYDLRLGDLTLIGSRNRTRQLVEYVAAVVGSTSAKATAITLPDLRLDPERVIGERVGILLEQLTLFAGVSGIAPIITGYEYDAIGGMTLRLSLIGATLNYWQYADGGISDGDTRRLFY